MLRGAGRRDAALRYTFSARRPADGSLSSAASDEREPTYMKGAALFIEIVQRHQHVGFRIIGADGARRNAVGHHRDIFQRQRASGSAV